MYIRVGGECCWRLYREEERKEEDVYLLSLSSFSSFSYALPAARMKEHSILPPFLSANIEGRVMDLRRRRRLHVRTYEQTTWTPTAIIIRGRWSFAGRTGRTYSSSPLPMCTRGTNTQTGNNNIDYDRPQRRRRREKCQEQ